MPSDKERIKYNWTEFCKFAEDEGISLDDEEDFGIWWSCWMIAQDFRKENFDE